MSEEKKPTDEEIAKAILQNIEYGSPITYIDEWGNCKDIMLTDILNLIYRLQDEKQKIIQDYYCESQQCDVQKAEIERLTSEINQRREMMSRMDYNYATELQKNAELQKQVDEWKTECQELHDGCEGCFAIAKGIQQQAEKDTAKEILQELWSETEATENDEWVRKKIKEIAKRKGIEVG